MNRALTAHRHSLPSHAGHHDKGRRTILWFIDCGGGFFPFHLLTICSHTSLPLGMPFESSLKNGGVVSQPQAYLVYVVTSMLKDILWSILLIVSIVGMECLHIYHYHFAFG